MDGCMLEQGPQAVLAVCAACLPKCPCMHSTISHQGIFADDWLPVHPNLLLNCSSANFPYPTLPHPTLPGPSTADCPFPTLPCPPQIFNLRLDPYERADFTSNTYYDWLLEHAWVVLPAQAYVAKMIETLAEFPPRQKPASFTIDQVLAKLQAGMPSS